MIRAYAISTKINCLSKQDLRSEWKKKIAHNHSPNCDYNLHEIGMPNHDTHLPSC